MGGSFWMREGVWNASNGEPAAAGRVPGRSPRIALRQAGVSARRMVMAGNRIADGQRSVADDVEDVLHRKLNNRTARQPVGIVGTMLR